jgi:hypothetical protein
VAVSAPAALGACLLVALPLVGLSAHADDSVLARGSSSRAPVTSAKATVVGVRSFSARVESSPSEQQVTGTWKAVCTIGPDRGDLSNAFSGRTPLTVSIPLTLTRTGRCTIDVTARGSRGRVTVTLHGT